MSQGKYSPCARFMSTGFEDCVFNARGEVPAPHTVGDAFNSEIHFANYDANGYDNYGYSAYDSNGNYVEIGDGVDPLGNTEMDYLVMDEVDWDYWHRRAREWAMEKGLI